MDGTNITKVHELPPSTHLAALVNDCINVDDGYGRDSSIYHLKYISFADETELQAWVIDAIGKKLTYKIIRVQPATVNIKTIVSVE